MVKSRRMTPSSAYRAIISVSVTRRSPNGPIRSPLREVSHDRRYSQPVADEERCDGEAEDREKFKEKPRVKSARYHVLSPFARHMCTAFVPGTIGTLITIYNHY